jgi:hypothetical protein
MYPEYMKLTMRSGDESVAYSLHDALNYQLEGEYSERHMTIYICDIIRNISHMGQT